MLALAIAAGSEWAIARPGTQPAAASSEYTNLATEAVGGTWSWPTGEANSDPLALRESAYTLELVRTTGMLTVQARTGTFSFPLTALVGRAALPQGAYFVATTDGSELSLYAFARQGLLLEKARVLAHPDFFTIDFSARLGRDPFVGATFFSNGEVGLPQAFLHNAFSPDPVSPSLSPTPTTFLGVHAPLPTAPFAPPPFDLQFHTGSGWAGFGLVQVPNATALSLTARGGISVNYPLGLLARIKDQGAGGRVSPPAGVPGQPGSGAWLGFPAFVVNLADTTSQGLTAYHDALAQLGEAPVAAPPGRRPAWWSQPMVDTWGQQLVTGASRDSPKFTAAWVRSFVAGWRQQFGVDHFTLVIDAQWQAKLGHTTPSSRFGGVAGMRRLIQELHAEGVKVMLWWPLWKNQTVPGQHLGVDPTAPGFQAQISRQMAALLGTGPNALGADGLKLDWGFLVPPPSQEHLSRPQLGIGAALLLRYMTELSRAAWKANPGAVVDGSAVAPQFGGTQDTLRLYDAHSASTWSYRAALVSAVDPLSQIDGDGWALTGPQAVTHIVESVVFGVPAIYYSTRWSGGQPIRRSLARALGALLAVGQERGQGQATLLQSGGWTYQVGSQVTARTLANSHGLVVYHYAHGRCRSATVISAVSTQVSVPNCDGLALRSILESSTKSPRLDRDGGSTSFTVAAGVRYQLTFGATRHRRRIPVVKQPVPTSPSAGLVYSAGSQQPAAPIQAHPTP